jgi:hypothetical protein
VSGPVAAHESLAVNQSRGKRDLADVLNLHVALRRPETMRINHEDTKGTKKRPEKTFVLFVSSRLIL